MGVIGVYQRGDMCDGGDRGDEGDKVDRATVPTELMSLMGLKGVSKEGKDVQKDLRKKFGRTVNNLSNYICAKMLRCFLLLYSQSEAGGGTS